MKILNLSQIETVTKTGGVLSGEMKSRIELWARMYAGCAEWQDESPSCGIEKAIAGALATPITEEVKIDSENEELKKILNKLHKDVPTIIEYFVSFGGCLLRPVYSNGRIQYELNHLGNYLPLSYDIDGSITAAIITKRINEGNKSFLLCEKHEYKNNAHTVSSTLYELTGDQIGKELPLTSTQQTADITPSFTWNDIDRPFIVEFRNREANKIDGSNVPVALISGAENLIQDADEQYARLIWENEAGKTKIFADADLFDKRQTKSGVDTVTHIDPKLKKLYVKLNGDGTSSEKITPFSPALRNNDLIVGFNKILQQIETVLDIGKGTISDLENVAKTATQFTGGKKAFYSKVDKYETELEDKYNEAAYVFAYMLSAYKLSPKFDPEITIEYNDMTRKDPREQKEMALREVGQNIMSKAEYRMKFYGESKEEAEANVPEEPAPSMFGNY